MAIPAQHQPLPTQTTTVLPANSQRQITTPQSPSTPAVATATVHSAAPVKQEITAATTSVGSKHAQQQLLQENEQFALAWLRATFEPAMAITSRVEQQDLYKMYLTASTKVGRTGVVSPMHFPRCVRSVFGGTVGPNSKNNYYEGIRIRAKPLAVMHKGTVLV